MKLFIKICLIISFIFKSQFLFAGAFEEIDIIPYKADNKLSLISFNQNIDNNGTNRSFFIYSLKNKRKVIDLKFLNSKYFRRYHPKSFEENILSIDYTNSINSSVFSYLKYNALFEFNQNIECIETNAYILGNRVECNNPNKQNYISQNSKIDISSRAIGFSLGRRNQNISWKTKNIFDMSINSNMVDSDVSLPPSFVQAEPNYDLDIHKNKYYYVNFVNLKLLQTRKIYKNWSLGQSLNFNFVHNDQITSNINSHVQYNLNFSKRMNSDFFFCLDLLFANNAYDNKESILTTKNFNTNASEKPTYRMNISFKKLINYEYENLSESLNKILFATNKIKKDDSYKKSNRHYSEISSKKHKLKPENNSLINFALLVANNHDMENLKFLN